MLCIEHLSFAYRRGGAVLDGLSLVIPAGRTVLLGPNGAGKSTLLALAADALPPRSGRVVLDSVGSPRGRASRRAYRSRVAWLPQQISPFPGLTVREHVAYAGWLKGLSRQDAWRRAGSAMDVVDLGAKADLKATQLSGGQARRMGIAGALVHEAEVMLLDEPTAGLDPSQRERFRDILRRIAPEVAVVVSTHQTEDVHESYDRVVLLHDGRVPFEGTVRDFVGPASATEDERDSVARAYARHVPAED
jgi:ABC-2 type transport system ATP-binding protein